MSEQMQEIEGPKSAPVIMDPGAAGWAEEPKITQAELFLYGDLAGAVRLLGQATVASADAYSLTCKHSHEQCFTDEDAAFYREMIDRSYRAHELVRDTYREFAKRAGHRLGAFIGSPGFDATDGS